MGKKIDTAPLKPVVGTLYPPPFDELRIPGEVARESAMMSPTIPI
jgi:hypothetical protein